MKKIKLKEQYPWYADGDYINVSDEIAEVLQKFILEEKTRKEKVKYHRAFYSLDTDDGMENKILFVSASPEEIYERKITNKELYIAMNQLPQKQIKCIYAHFFQDMSFAQIARIDGVKESSIRESIDRGLKKIEKNLKNF